MKALDFVRAYNTMPVETCKSLIKHFKKVNYTYHAWQDENGKSIKLKKNRKGEIKNYMMEENEQNILIDTSPDLRHQLYKAKCTNIDAVLFTHEHSDHTAGLPDMRAMSLINKSIIPAYLPFRIKDSISNNYKYIFQGEKEYSPFMNAITANENFQIGDLNIKSFKHNHGSIDVQTFRINNFAYSTDIKNFYENDIDKLKNLDLWIVGLLRYDSHPSHAGFDQILDYINYLKPKKLFLHT